MAKIHFIGGEKGGVGKSVVSRLLAQYMIDKEILFRGFDTDRSHGALMRFYAGFASPTLVDSYEALDSIMESAAAEPERRMLVDLAAQTHDPLVKWIDESGVLDLAAEGSIEIFYWHVMDAGKDSVDLLTRVLDQFGDRVNYVLVLNELRGSDFGILKNSGELARAEALGAKTVSVRRLHDASMNKIDATSSSFWAAKNAGEGHGLGLMDRQRVKTWLRDAYAQLDRVGI